MNKKLLLLSWYKDNLWYIPWRIRCKIRIRLMRFAEKHLWFRKVYGWYFKRFRFDKGREYGGCVRVETIDLYDDRTIAEKFAWQINILIPAALRCKIEYVKCSNGLSLFDTIGWIYNGTQGVF